MTRDAFISMISALSNKQFTDQQIEFLRDFRTPVLSWSLPGTGKTTASIAGLIVAQYYDNIPGENIYALSFTKNATAEIANRHNAFLTTLHKRQTVNFKTLYAICHELLKKNYHRMGMPTFKIASQEDDISKAIQIEAICTDMKIMLRPYQARKILEAIRFLNNSFQFGQKEVESRYAFRICGLDFITFNKIRKQAYHIGKLTGNIDVGEIPLYTEELLRTCPDISKAFKAKCRVMLIDEFQDMSRLQLAIASKLSDNIIAIGDINQQIYAFNGACQEIVDFYSELYPAHKRADLTQSFRCPIMVVQAAAKIITPNQTGGEHITPRNDIGACILNRANKATEIYSRVETEFKEYQHFESTYLFLYRNNVTALDIADKLYERRVPFYVDKYVPVTKFPIIRDIVRMVDFLRNPEDLSSLGILSKFIREFRHFKEYTSNPLYKPMKQSGLGFMEINYDYTNQNKVTDIFEVFMDIQAKLYEGGLAKDILVALYKILYDETLFMYADKMDTPPDIILARALDMTNDLTWRQFTLRETEKAAFIEKNRDSRRGIRCCTFHAAKGMEADVVVIFGANQGIVPNDSILKRMKAEKCYYDIAREIRNERSLCYVAVTRAKSELFIYYDGDYSLIMNGSDAYQSLDKYYFDNKILSTDEEAFIEFTKVGST